MTNIMDNEKRRYLLEYSGQTNLLEQSAYRYQLQDVPEPNLYRHLFDYESVPKTPFNHRQVPMQMPEDIFITDTTFRDGQQSTAPFTPEQIVDNAKEVLATIIKLKPAAAKGSYVKSIYLSTTMSPGLQIDPKSVETK